MELKGNYGAIRNSPFHSSYLTSYFKISFLYFACPEKSLIQIVADSFSCHLLGKLVIKCVNHILSFFVEFTHFDFVYRSEPH